MESIEAKIKFLIIIFSMVTCGFPLDCSACKIDSLIILKTNWDLLTDIPISASGFFGLPHTRYCIKDQKTIKKFNEQLESLENIQDKRPNVRCKIYLFSNDSIMSTVSCSLNSVFLNGMSYRFSDDFLSLIEETVSKHKSEPSNDKDFPVYSNFLTTDSEIIRHHVDSLFLSQSDSIKNKDFRIIVRCKAEIYGYVIDAKVYDLPDGLKNIEEALTELVVKNVKWNYNPERSRTELLLFSISFKKSDKET